MITILTTRVALVLAMLICLCLAPARAQEKAAAEQPDTATVFRVPLRYDPPRINRPLVQLRINGEDPENFILDTGCGAPLIITKSYVKRLGLKYLKEKAFVNQSIYLRTVEVKTAVLEGETNTANLAYIDQALVTDAPLESLAPGQNVVGVVGIELFADQPVTMDFKAQLLTLHTAPGAFSPPSLGPTLMSQTSGGIFEIEVSPVSGVQTRMIIDTGACNGVIGQAILSKLPRSCSQTTVAGQVQGVYLVETARVLSFAVGGITQTDLSFTAWPAFAKDPRNSLLGMEVLQDLRLTWDIPNKRVYFEPNRSPRFHRPLAHSGASLIADGKKTRVRRVEKGSPAAGAGLQAGDEVVSIDGIAASGEAVTAMERVLDGLVGEEARIEIKRAMPQTLRFMRLETFKSSEPFMPCFQGITGRILFGKPLEILTLKPDAPLFLRGVRVGEQVTHINGKELARQNLESIFELLRVQQVTLVVRGKNGKERTLRVTAPDTRGKKK